MVRFDQNRFDDIDICCSLENIEIRVLYVRYESPVSQRYFTYHCHNSFELHIIPQGYGKLNVFGESYDITPGTFYITGPGVYHEQIANQDDPMSEYSMNFEFRTKQNKSENNELQLDIDMIISALKKNKFWFGKDIYDNALLINKAIAELNTKEVGYVFSVKNLLIQVIINTARIFLSHQKSAFNIPKKSLDGWRSELIDSYFNRIYAITESPELLARKLGTSVRQLNRILKQNYNMTFTEKMMQMRIAKAKGLLSSSRMTIEKISESIGFLNTSYFNAVFKKSEGMTPTEYRNRYFEG